MNQPFFPSPILQPQPVIQQVGDEVPARVRVAMDFLSHCTMKTMVRGMVNDVGFDTIDGQQLTEEELSAQGSACLLLQKFFRGRLKPSHAEHLVLDAMESREGESGSDLAIGHVGLLMRCFSCAPNPPQSSCPFCKGQGEVIVYPKTMGG